MQNAEPNAYSNIVKKEFARREGLVEKFFFQQSLTLRKRELKVFFERSIFFPIKEKKMTQEELLAIYTDYLISQNKYATATGLEALLEGEVSHDC